MSRPAVPHAYVGDSSATFTTLKLRAFVMMSFSPTEVDCGSQMIASAPRLRSYVSIMRALAKASLNRREMKT